MVMIIHNIAIGIKIDRILRRRASMLDTQDETPCRKPAIIPIHMYTHNCFLYACTHLHMLVRMVSMHVVLYRMHKDQQTNVSTSCPSTVQVLQVKQASLVPNISLCTCARVCVCASVQKHMYHIGAQILTLRPCLKKNHCCQ